MAFTYDITTDVGKVRMQIGDRTVNRGVRPDSANFSDEEITGALTETGSVKAAAAGLLEILSYEWATVADITLGPRKESFSQVSKQFEKLATKLREQVGSESLGAVVHLGRHDGYHYHDHASESVSGEYVVTRRYYHRYRGVQ